MEEISLKITPLDIKKQDFRKVMRGYDPIEIETFLEMVAEEFESLIKQKNNLSDDVLKLKTQLSDYQEVEKTFKESLMNAQQTMNQSRENSKREATLIIKEAEVRAEKIIENAKKQLIDMKNELMIIKAQKDSFAKRLQHLLASQLELIKVLEIDDIGYDEQKIATKTKQSKGNILKSEGSQLNQTLQKKNELPKNINSLKNVKMTDQFIM